MTDGNRLLPELIGGQGNPAAVAISRGDDLTKGKCVVVPRDPSRGRVRGESSVVVAESRANSADLAVVPVASLNVK